MSGAEMRFRSQDDPDLGGGTLILSDDGTFSVRPDEALRDEMARLEEVTLGLADAYGTRLGLALLGLGALALLAGWRAGRVFGKLGFHLGRPRPVREVSLARGEGGTVRLSLPGAVRWQRFEFIWTPGEEGRAEADEFLAGFERMKTETGKMKTGKMKTDDAH